MSEVKHKVQVLRETICVRSASEIMAAFTITPRAVAASGANASMLEDASATERILLAARREALAIKEQVESATSSARTSLPNRKEHDDQHGATTRARFSDVDVIPPTFAEG